MSENVKKKKRELDMTSRPLLGKIFLFSLPIMATGILQLLYNASDIITLGQFASDVSAGAVGSTGSLINLITNLFLGLSVGACTAAPHVLANNPGRGLELARCEVREGYAQVEVRRAQVDRLARVGLDVEAHR